MKTKILSLLGVIILGCSTLESQNRISINIPTVEEESAYVWSSIQDISFFEKHNYQLKLPEGKLINTLLTKSKNNQLFPADFDALLAFMKTKVYNVADYQQGYQKIKDQQPLINKLVKKLGKCKRNWDFKPFDVYQVNLTLYGPGGNYNPDNGSILIQTTTTGGFKQYANPANTIIHEITHIGIEASIINKYQVPHIIKERIVDLYVSFHFKKYLDQYQIQNMGHNEIDQYLKKKRDFKDLNKIVAKFMKENEVN
ncbi:MAG: hypothetical protein AB8G15_16165 [Saprospiraceae bacterium]